MSWEKWSAHYDMSGAEASAPPPSSLPAFLGPPPHSQPQRFPVFLPRWGSGQAPRSPQRDEGFFPFSGKQEQVWSEQFREGGGVGK